MVDQQEREFRRKFAGNAAFYADLDEHRQRTFLLRNLKAVLRSHAQRLRSGAQRKPACKIEDEDTIRVDNSGAKSLQKPKWTSPSRAILDDIKFRKFERVLKIDVKGLVKEQLNKENAVNAASWNTNIKSEIPCHVQLRIVDISSSKERTVLRDAVLGTIRSSNGQADKDGIQIQLDAPFYVNVEKLFVDVKKGNRRKKSVASSYSMVIVISPMDSATWLEQDTQRLKNALKLHHSYTEAQAMMKVGKTKDLRAFYGKWSHLPLCQDNQKLLQLFTYSNAKLISDFGLVVEMGWNRQKSPLEKYNSFLRDSPAVRFPTPVSEKAQETRKVEVTYVFGSWLSHTDGLNMKEWSVLGYRCPFCHGRDMSSFQLLSIHLRNCHALFKFDIEHLVNLEASDGRIDVCVKVDVHNDLRENLINSPAYLEEIDWQRPRRPFDIKKYLEGDHSWIEGGQNLSRSLKRKRQMSLSAPSAGLSLAPGSAQDEGVLDIPPPKRKKFVVPPAPTPDIRFFRTTSKRVLNEGEEISESDDEVDESWLIHKHDEVIDDFIDVSNAEKEFIKRWDAHMLKEGLCGNIHFAEAMVRFARANKTWLCRTAMFVEFSKIAAKMRLCDTVTEAVIWQCIQIVQEEAKTLGIKLGLPSADEPSDVTQSPLSHRDSRSGQYHLRSGRDKSTQDTSRSPASNEVKVETGEAHPEPGATPLNNNGAPAVDDAPQRRAAYGECCCGKTISDFHNAIICSDVACLQPDFHLSCAGLKHREPGWLCPRCTLKRNPPGRPEQLVELN